MTKIVAKTCNFSINYQKQPLPELFLKQNTDSDFSDDLNQIEANRLIEWINDAQMSLIVSLDKLNHEAIVRALQKQADNGVRIYLLLGDKNANQSAIETLSGRCLIRTGVQQQGAFCLRDHATDKEQGLMIMSNAPFIQGEQKAWFMELEEPQIEDSYRSFCQLFWEASNEEFIRQNQPRKTVKHPDGDIVVNHSYHQKDKLNSALQEALSSLKMTTFSRYGEGSNNAQLLLSIDCTEIKKQAGSGVALTENTMPRIILSDSENWLLPDQIGFKKVNWGLKLSDTQSSHLELAMRQAMTQAAWQYHESLTIGSLTQGEKVRFVDQPTLVRNIEQNRQQTLEDYPTNHIDQFLNDASQNLVAHLTEWQKDGLAHQINFTVDIHPPYAPESATADPLYQQWENAEKNWQDRLDGLNKQMEAIEQQQNNIKAHLRSFIKGFLLGQGHSSKTIYQKIENLRGWHLQEATPAERESKAAKLESLQNDVDARSEKTKVELKNAENQHQWTEKKQALEQSLKQAQSQVKKASDNHQQLESQRLAKKKEAEDKFLSEWKQAIEALNPKQLTTLGESKESLIMMSLEEIQAFVGQKITSKNQKKKFKSLHPSLDNFRQAENKINRDMKDAQEKLGKANSHLVQVEQQLKDHGDVFRGQPDQKSEAFDQQLGLKKKQTSYQPMTWPKEELPHSKSRLLKHKQQRYLEVQETDQLNLARNDASRLDAQIVCDKEVANHA